MESVIEDIAYLDFWFNENMTCFIKPYIENNFHEESWPYQLSFMKKHLFFTKKIIENDKMGNGEKQIKLLNSLSFGKSKIVLIVGGRGSGKTGDAAWIMEELHNKKLHRNIFFVKQGMRPRDLPEWASCVSDIDEVPNNTIAIVDESAIRYNSRNSWSDDNKDFVKRLVILRHKGVSVILLTQHKKMLEIGARRLADLIIYKRGADLKGNEEERADDDKILIRSRLLPRHEDETLVEITMTNEFFKFTHRLPEWFTDEFSKLFSSFNPEEQTNRVKAERMRYAKEQKYFEFEKKKEIELAKLEKLKELGLKQESVANNKKEKKIIKNFEGEEI